MSINLAKKWSSSLQEYELKNDSLHKLSSISGIYYQTENTRQKASGELSLTHHSSSEIQESCNIDKIVQETSELIKPIEEYGNLVKNLIDTYKDRLTKYLKNHDLAHETDDLAADLIMEISNKYSFKPLGELLQEIYVENYFDISILCSICDILGGYDFDEFKPWGQAFLFNLFLHKNEKVKEYALMLCENWSDSSMLPMLNNIEVSSKWLQDYLDEIIKRLEG